MDLKKIGELKKISSDACNYIRTNKKNTNLFEKIFISDNIVDKIISDDIFFIVGEKGSGKTAYSVYITNKSQEKSSDFSSYIEQINNTVYEKFLMLKKEKKLEYSTFTEIWKNLIYLSIFNKLKDIYSNKLFSKGKSKEICAMIDLFNSVAFKPDIPHSFALLNYATETVGTSISKLPISFNAEMQDGNNCSEKYYNYEMTQYTLNYEFESAINELKIDKQIILFIDGIDIRPEKSSNTDYLKCLEGLVNAVININRISIANIKVVLLIRPDILYNISFNNMNQVVMNNSIILKWNTPDSSCFDSKLFKIADNYFAKQQNKQYALGECWNKYMNFKTYNPSTEKYDRNPFITIIHKSFYKPRDIITMLNFMCASCNENSMYLSMDNYKASLKSYYQYILSELKDYMFIYLSKSEYKMFLMFWRYFDYEINKFSYTYFRSCYSKYTKNVDASLIPEIINTPNKMLQILYDCNIVGYLEYKESLNRYISFWAFTERSYANINPQIKLENDLTLNSVFKEALKCENLISCK